MFGITGSVWLPRFLIAAGMIGAFSLPAATAGEDKPLQIGMAQTFFYEKSKATIDIATGDFNAVLKETSGLTGRIVSRYGAFEVAEKLISKELDIGILHGHEFAWVQKKHPEIRPLVLAANKARPVQAYLIVHKNSSVKNVADLRGAMLDLPMASSPCSRLFVERNCTTKDQITPAAFFGSIGKSPSQEDALNEVCRGKVQAAVVDVYALEFYKEIRLPLYEKHLKVLHASEVFPAPIIVYREGGINPTTLARFRDGLLKANQTKLGSEMMKEWRIDAFEPVSPEYMKSLEGVLKTYPPPAASR
jgi:ABC-type phosphate/phosphonate transport system substrate-binding protein